MPMDDPRYLAAWDLAHRLTAAIDAALTEHPSTDEYQAVHALYARLRRRSSMERIMRASIFGAIDDILAEAEAEAEQRYWRYVASRPADMARMIEAFERDRLNLERAQQ